MLKGELTYLKSLSLISRGVGMWIQPSDFRPLALRKNMCEGLGKNDNKQRGEDMDGSVHADPVGPERV